jgi:hypothetical protein
VRCGFELVGGGGVESPWETQLQGGGGVYSRVQKKNFKNILEKVIFNMLRGFPSLIGVLCSKI